MTAEPRGEIKAAFPATTKGAYGQVRKISVCPKATATGVVSIQCGGITIKQFNTPAATGPLDHPFHIGGEGDELDPTVYTIVPDGAGNGAWVTYWAD